MLYLPQHEPTQGQVLTSIWTWTTQGQVSTSICSIEPTQGQVLTYMLYLPQHEPTQGQVPPSTWTHPGSGINIYMLYLPQHEPTQGQVSTSICSTSLNMNPPRVRYQHLYALPPSTWTHPGSGINIYMLYLPQHEPTQGQVNIYMLYLPTQGQVSTSICSTSLSMNPPRVRY